MMLGNYNMESVHVASINDSYYQIIIVLSQIPKQTDVWYSYMMVSDDIGLIFKLSYSSKIIRQCVNNKTRKTPLSVYR